MAKKKSRKPKDGAYRLDADLVDKANMNNEKFNAYYRAQNILPEEEWQSMLETLRRALPTTFRVAGCRQTAKELNRTIEETYVPSLSGAMFEDMLIPPPSKIPWYPDGLAWQFNVPKNVLRKQPEFKKFHSFLVFETEVGNISRQEAVSMLPPLFLGVEPHHRVIDMCAAPGSKTAQILEALHAHDTPTSTSIPSGFVIANDSDNKRTHLLIHQSARLPSPALMVTNLDASIYPIIKVPDEYAKSKGKAKNKKTDEMLLFDRILCDVPCSGDGTIRKNIGIWKTWSCMDGNGLHGLQLRILQRGMKMLKDDGKIVYSTCSLNPVENEAVVAAALNWDSDFELADVSSFPSLVHRSGLTTWIPAVDKDVTTRFETYADFVKEKGEEWISSNSKMTVGHWPPENAKRLGLERCLRIYPHLQDTGGFFIAVLQKKKYSVNAEDGYSGEKKRDVGDVEDIGLPERKKPRLEGADTEPQKTISPELVHPLPPKPLQQGKQKKNGGGSFKENPYTFLLPDDPILQSCMAKLNLSSSFPTSNVLVRNPDGEAVRSLYLTNDIVKAILQYNDYSRLRLTAAGTKVFAKQEAGKGADAQFRTLGEGLPVVLPFMKPESILEGSAQALKTLVQSYYPLCSTFNEPFRGGISQKDSGSHIARFPASEYGEVILTTDIVLPLWKSNVSVALMIDKKAKSALSLRLFGEDITTAGREATQRKRVAATPTPSVDIGPDGALAEDASAMITENEP